jgi:nitronate monooxygenase
MEEGADIIFAGAGLPLDLPRLKPVGSRTRLVPIVSSARAFRIIATRWLGRYRYPPDAVVVEGPLAGGHLGFKREQISDQNYSLERLVPEVVREARRFEAQCGRPIPVIAAGGIYTGHDIHRFLELGAAGVQMATRFVGTWECDAAPRFKQAYIDARKDDIVIIQSPVGMPGRAIRNRYTDNAAAGNRRPFHCPYHCIATCDVAKSPFCIAVALKNAREGNLEEGFAFAGANAYRVSEIVSVKELVAELEAEYDRAAGGPADPETSKSGVRSSESELAVAASRLAV